MPGVVIVLDFPLELALAHLRLNDTCPSRAPVTEAVLLELAEFEVPASDETVLVFSAGADPKTRVAIKCILYGAFQGQSTRRKLSGSAWADAGSRIWAPAAD